MKKNLITVMSVCLLGISPGLFAAKNRPVSKPERMINKPVVVGELIGQLGNNLFQVATTCALAWDNDAEPCFPDLNYHPKLYQHVFSRFNKNLSYKGELPKYGESSFKYAKIPYTPNMRIGGYFQSEKYFAHYKEKLVAMLAPTAKDLSYMKKKYKWLFEHPKSVGVQLRNYFEDANGDIFYQYGADYLEKTLSLFPEDSLFVISSNNIEWAKKIMPSWVRNVRYLEGEAHYIDMYLLSFCKDNIITNSSFGWWAAWLNQNPDKKVICPQKWTACHTVDDICPPEWIRVLARSGKNSDPSSY